MNRYDTEIGAILRELEFEVQFTNKIAEKLDQDVTSLTHAELQIVRLHFQEIALLKDRLSIAWSGAHPIRYRIWKFFHRR